MESTHAQSHPHISVAIALGMTFALGPLALNTYLPAFPYMAEDLGTTFHQISLSVSIYIFTQAFGQLVAGPLSDQFGRSLAMLTGMFIFGVASLLISTASSIEELLAWRALQAFGAGWATVCVPAIVNDRMSGADAARFFSLIGMVMLVAPVIAPGIGSGILYYTDWHAIFWLQCAYAFGMAILLKRAVFNSNYSQPAHNPGTSALQRYREVLATRPALPFLFIQALTFTVMLLFVTHSPFIYQEHFGAGPTRFTLLFAANVILMMAVNIANRHFLKHYSPERLLGWALIMQGSGIVFLVLVMCFIPKLWLFLPGMMVTTGAMGALIPNTQACFMQYFRQHGGSASAVLGATQYFIGGLICGASSLLPKTVLAVILAQGACALICLVLHYLPKPQTKVA